jgi:hypothetical protein
VRAAAEASLGLHAARVASPFATAAVRTAECTPLTELLGEQGHAELVTIRCVRKTLHTLPVDMAVYAHGATRHYRLRDVAALARRQNVTTAQLESAAARIIAYLRTNGRQSHRTIESALTVSKETALPVRLALKWLWEKGEVTYRNCAPSWHQEQRRFDLRSVSHPDFDTSLAQDLSTARLVRAYFHRYGPATVKDMAWWSGLGQRSIVSALSELDVVKLSLPWAASPFFMLRTDFEQFLSASPYSHRTGFHLLAHEDVALKAYFESRSRYLGSLPNSVAFNQIGEVRSCIIYNGQIIGLWSWHHERRQVCYRSLCGRISKTDRNALTRQAKSLEQRLRSGYISSTEARSSSVQDEPK